MFWLDSLRNPKPTFEVHEYYEPDYPRAKLRIMLGEEVVRSGFFDTDSVFRYKRKYLTVAGIKARYAAKVEKLKAAEKAELNKLKALLK